MTKMVLPGLVYEIFFCVAGGAEESMAWNISFTPDEVHCGLGCPIDDSPVTDMPNQVLVVVLSLNASKADGLSSSFSVVEPAHAVEFDFL